MSNNEIIETLKKINNNFNIVDNRKYNTISIFDEYQQRVGFIDYSSKYSCLVYSYFYGYVRCTDIQEIIKYFTNAKVI